MAHEKRRDHHHGHHGQHAVEQGCHQQRGESDGNQGRRRPCAGDQAGCTEHEHEEYEEEGEAAYVLVNVHAEQVQKPAEQPHQHETVQRDTQTPPQARARLGQSLVDELGFVGSKLGQFRRPDRASRLDDLLAFQDVTGRRLDCAAGLLARLSIQVGVQTKTGLGKAHE